MNRSYTTMLVWYAPGKVVIPLGPTSGPGTLGDFISSAGQVAIYACGDRRYSLSTEDPSDLADQVDQLIQVGG